MGHLFAFMRMRIPYETNFCWFILFLYRIWTLILFLAVSIRNKYHQICTSEHSYYKIYPVPERFNEPICAGVSQVILGNYICNQMAASGHQWGYWCTLRAEKGGMENVYCCCKATDCLFHLRWFTPNQQIVFTMTQMSIINRTKTPKYIPST